MISLKPLEAEEDAGVDDWEARVSDEEDEKGSLKPPQTAQAFPVHNLLEKLLYAEWDHPDKRFFPPKKFSTLYPMEERFIKMWGIPAIDAAISSVNNSLTCPVDNAQMLRDPVDKKMESLLKDVFSLAGSVAQPAVAAIGVCQYLRDHIKQVIKVLPEQQAQGLANLPAALCYVVDAIRDSIMQTSRLSLGLVHIRRILWLKTWSAEAPCKKLLAGFTFRGERLFGEDLDNYIKRISCGKSTLLPVKKKKKKPVKEQSSDSESESDDDRTKEEQAYDKAKKRIEKRRIENQKTINFQVLRAPVICVLGHVDTGKTKILDKLRHTHVQDSEAGGITQQIGATNVPLDAIKEQTKMVKNFDRENIKIPGMLIIDTPGHESFSNLRNRGSSLCDIAILVVDIMHGLEPQTIESLNLLKNKKCPFIVALNKVDRLYDWKKSPETDVAATLKKQKKNTKDEFEERTKAIIVEFAQQGLNAALFFENKDPRTFVSLVPTSAHTGDGMGNLIHLLVELTQSMLGKRLAHSEELRAQVMEVKALPGMGTTIDVILINGRLKEGDTIIVPGVEGPIVTQIRGLLLPPPMKELRVKNQYEKHKEVPAAQGVKILGKDLEKTLAGLPLLVAHKEDEIPVLRDELIHELKQTLNAIKLEEKGVYVQASTLGSLEALLEFLKTSEVPYAGINIGPVHKKDIMKASVMLEHDPQYAVILAFDVRIEREAQEMADSLGVRVFSAEIIYHLFDAFTKYRQDYKKQKQEEFKHIAVFPCKIRILPQFIFNSRDPIVMGVIIEAGQVKQGTPICVPSKNVSTNSCVTLH
ncbi:hypothetical protein AB205_0020720 [Aquarana catesbeiana]|uniref:Eukaryotic translation initiation factor 5B n=1 Tax=Aquarana catesbeiana TaxID=8400 RepID=A0A2G9SA21_AQUCT|nr:hypothetical protein AB205_0020720 [Aquarana catesbeiana]